MLIMVLLVLGISFLQNIMDLLSYVLNLFNEPGGFVGLYVSMRSFDLCGCKGKSYINGAQWLKSQAYLKRDVTSRVVNSCVAHMEIYHPMCVDIWSCTSIRCA
jgi:hypothetical protein